MARIRTIKPQFWLDEELGLLPRDARLLYIGLWNLCDDKGVFEYKPGKIRVQLFPYDQDIDNNFINKLLSILEQSCHVIKFSENSEWYGFIKTFSKHQEIKKPSKWSYTNTLPDTNSTPPVPHQYPTSGEPVTGSTLKEKEKEKEKEKLEGKEKEKISRSLHGEFLNVLLSDEEHGKLIERFGINKTKELIESLSSGIKSKGYKYKDHYATILNWSRRDGNSNGNGQHGTNPRELPKVYTTTDEFYRTNGDVK